MSERIDFAPLARACDEIANEVAESSGFVPMHKLLSRFRARLILRPLLVEGMLGKTTEPEADKSQWIVLIDSEKYPKSDTDVAQESAQKPLPERMRFTIAHELAHSLAFRYDEFEIRLQHAPRDGQAQKAFVREMELGTDRLSSRLLWPQRAVETYLGDERDPFSVKRLARLRRELAVSRYALIYRLLTFKGQDERGLLSRSTAQNVGVGLGEWTAKEGAIFRKRPVFLNFARNVIPEVFLKVMKQNGLPARSVFKDDNFVLCGGNSLETELFCAGGLESVPEAERMRIRVEVEETGNRPRGAFLFQVRRVD